MCRKDHACAGKKGINQSFTHFNINKIHDISIPADTFFFSFLHLNGIIFAYYYRLYKVLKYGSHQGRVLSLKEVVDLYNEEVKMSEATSSTSTPATVPVKSFMTAGPTLHYSHTNVIWFWGLTIVVFLLACYFWFLLMPLPLDTEDAVTGLSDFGSVWNLFTFRLGQIVQEPISIYEYPWYIVVLGMLMGILAVVPVLVSQLLSFRFSILLVLAIMFIAKLYLFGVMVLISCIAVACRPLRFRSRFISLALCMAPQLIYWAIGGGYPTTDPVRWGFSFAPWIHAWFSGLAIAAIVLGIGHFTRYKPGLIWLTCLVFLGIAFAVFQRHIGLAELDYHRYVAGNDPEDAIEFHEKSLSETIDKVMEDNFLRSRLEGRFYPTEPNELRQKLKEEIQDFLAFSDRWPEWFRRKMPDELKYQIKRQSLMMEYDKFIVRWPGNQKRMPIVLYYKAILSEFHPDVRLIIDKEMLRFYCQYPFEDNILKWQELYENFAGSRESLEARWRIAMDLAGQGEFDKALTFCQIALDLIDEQLHQEASKPKPEKPDSFFEAFQEPPETVMTPFKLRELNLRLRKLQSLIAEENWGSDEAGRKRLAEFVMLNPHELSYAMRLDGLLEQMSETDGLRDNVLLEKAKLIDDLRRRSRLLNELAHQYPGRDATAEALYESGLINIQLLKNTDLSETQKNELVTETRMILSNFIERHPDSPFVQQAQATLQTLPQAP